MRIAGRVIAALSLQWVACANATQNDEPTWPEWHAPRVTKAPPEPAGPRSSGLADGVLGLRHQDAPEASADVPRAPDPWAAFPVHAGVFHFLAHVFEAPRPAARAIGYYRRGAQLRTSEEVGRDGCPGGWHQVWGGGFVCRNQGYTLRASAQPRPEESPAPNLLDALPYAYVKVVAPAVQTWQVPGLDHEAEVESLLRVHAQPSSASTPLAQNTDGDAGVDAESPLPDWVRMIDEPGHYLSVAGEEVREDGRVFLRTVRGAYLPKEATLSVEAPRALGTPVGGALQLPLAIAVRPAKRFASAVDGAISELAPAARGSVLRLSGLHRERGRTRYLQTHDGEFVQESRVAIISQVSRPALVPAAARWVHVDLSTQTLVAYEGDRPVFATLISSGKQGYETPSGLFRVHAKHVTATMDDTAQSEGAYYIEDVPWTMYFEGSYALHAAFWHSRFGTPRSHGCVNLAPADAQYLFRFLDPQVPGGRHGVLVPTSRASYVMVDAGA